MQKLFVPHLGTILVLGADWTFKLYFEDRNNTLLSALCPKKFESKNPKDFHEKYLEKYNGTRPEDWEDSGLLLYEKALSEEQLQMSFSSYRATNSNDEPYILATLPAGTQLTVSRIYIRQGAAAFDSMSFWTNKHCPNKNLRGKRFWAKLIDVNKIYLETVI